MSEKDAEIERLEIRVTELESELDVRTTSWMNTMDALSECKENYKALRFATSDLIDYAFRRAESYDNQLETLCGLIGEKVPGEEDE